jgi:hypothetical protein
LKKKKFGLYQNFWHELYLRSVFFYNKKTSIGDIPLVLVTKHNNILPFYMKNQINNIKTTILHFDTHPDMNDVKNSSILPNIYKDYISSKDLKYINKAQEIVWDIGAAISGVLFTTGIQNYTWCMPEWVPDPEVNTSYFLKKNKYEIKAYTNDKKLENDSICDITYTNKINNENNADYIKIQTGKKNNKFNIKNLIKNIKNNYILDIDLDYFVCNGDKLNIKEYLKDQYDVESFYRTHKIIFNQNIPRDSSENTPELKKYENELKKEVKYINKRIKKFLSLINSLNKKNYKPKYISICDSTNIEFYKCDNCNTISNGYVPTNLALYVHTKVYNGLKDIFIK